MLSNWIVLLISYYIVPVLSTCCFAKQFHFYRQPLLTIQVLSIMKIQMLLHITQSVVLLFAFSCNCFELYSDEDFIGLLPFQKTGVLPWPENPKNCSNFPPHYRQVLSSVRTNEECVILYDKTNCEGQSVKLTKDATNFRDLVKNVTNDNFDNKAASIQFCDEEEGLTKIGVELYAGANYEGDTIFQLDDLCKCTNLPTAASFLSIDNHHHCIQLHSTSDCSRDDPLTETIFPGKSSLSGNIQSSPIHNKVKAIRPCTVPSHCVKIAAKIYQYDVDNDDYSTFNLEEATTALNLNAKTIFRNNGTATITQEYTVSREVTESTEIEIIEFSSRVESWGTEKTSYKSFGLHIIAPPINLYLNVGKGLEDAYSKTQGEGHRNTEKYISETTTEFGTSQLISVPPCTIYEVDSSVLIVENMPLGYKVYFKLTGEQVNEVKMTAEELIEQVKAIEEYTYNHTIDEYTISAFSRSSISMSFGVQVEIDAVGSRFPNCG